MRRFAVLIFVVTLLFPIVSFAQDNGVVVEQVKAIRDMVQSLQQQHLIKIGAFTYGKVIYKFNYSIGKIKNICNCENVNNVAIKAELKTLIDMLDDLDCSHKVTYCNCKGELNFVRCMWTLTKLMNSL
jgi:hypothetical protein